MHTMTATHAKTRFGQVLQTALVEPVAIEKNGRELAFVVSAQHYHQLQESIQLNRREFDAFVKALDAPGKSGAPNAAMRRAMARHKAAVVMAKPASLEAAKVKRLPVRKASLAA